ncbi:hypothetical protein ACTMU2_19045 [Cupriavidus basilensis]
MRAAADDSKGVTEPEGGGGSIGLVALLGIMLAACATLPFLHVRRASRSDKDRSCGRACPTRRACPCLQSSARHR